MISHVISTAVIRGLQSETTLIHTPDSAYPDFKPARVLVLGLGQSDSFDLDGVRRVSAAAARKLRSSGLKNVSTIVHGAGIGGLEPLDSAQAIVEGSILGSYRFRRHKTVNDNVREDLDSLSLVESDASKLDQITTGMTIARAVAEA
ncbi:MAG: M17 family peptidase N-terminal domain-containing protein, partial [Euryarchaeota archaeon]